MLYILAAGIIAVIISGIKKGAVSGPAACGMSLAVIIFGIPSIQTIIGILLSEIPKDIASISAFVVLTFLGGYFAAKTNEDTASMNTKIIAVVGAAPYLIFLTIFTSSFVFWFLVAAYIPCIFAGYKKGKKYNIISQTKNLVTEQSS